MSWYYSDSSNDSSMWNNEPTYTELTELKPEAQPWSIIESRFDDLSKTTDGVMLSKIYTIEVETSKKPPIVVEESEYMVSFTLEGKETVEPEVASQTDYQTIEPIDEVIMCENVEPKKLIKERNSLQTSSPFSVFSPFKSKPLKSVYTKDDLENISDVECIECNKVFSKPCYLKQHIKAIHSGYNFKCDICGKAFSTMAELKGHVGRHSGNKKYKCEYCPKQYNFKNDLDRHRLRHTVKNRKHVCNICSKGFARRDHMINHRETHRIV
ncbi:zinc finger protein 680-like [Aethina tumida]|uniref:zinc finger protein 680-like n=1 Tax=Aethina tumida TaxID=116153 RepID=UPI0021497489|nr:zinc finger protein 680-like [Aethina tumida]